VFTGYSLPVVKIVGKKVTGLSLSD